MKPAVLVAGLVGMLALIVGGVVMMMSQGGGAAAYSTMTGPELYQKLCQQCHGPKGTAPTGVANSYAGKRKYWNEESLLAFIANPKAMKSKMPHLSSSRFMNPISKSVPMDARRKLVQHVLEKMDLLERD